jgi:phosphomannomutase
MYQIKFGTDGWRGIIAADFTVENVKRVAQGTAEYLKKNHADNLHIVLATIAVLQANCLQKRLHRSCVPMASK